MDSRSLIANTPSDANPNVFILAYEKCLPRFMAIPADKVTPTNLDIPWATSAALGAIPEVMKLRDQASRMREVRISAFDEIRDVTLALSHANALFQAASESPDELVSLGDRAYKWREKLRAVINSYVVCGILDPKAMDNYGGLKGYRNVATDLQVLTSILINAWIDVGAICPIRRDELDTVANLAAGILTSIGLREQAPASTEAAADIRNRASVDFLSCWQEVGRAVTFLRWYEGDANDILPPLFSPPAKHKNDAGNTEPSAPSSPETPAPAPADPANPNPGGSPFID